jgi:ADP-ribose pyrophosphatase
MTRKTSDAVLPWQLIASSVTFADRWLRVRSDHCRTSRGVEVNPFHVIEYPDWVNVVALTRHTHQLVLVNEYRHGRGEVVTGLVSGTVESGDGADPSESAARRELWEETGYRAGTLSKLLATYPNPANQSNLAVSWLALDVEPGDSRSLDDSEDIEVVLADLPDVMLRLRSGALLMQGLHVAALWTATARIVAGDIVVDAALRRRLAPSLGMA